MPQPIAICIEDLEASGPETRYLRCVAVAGGDAGLRVCVDGQVRWRSDEEATAFELWVSLDERLILLRPAGAPPVRVSRAGRSLEAPEEKPVVLLGGDRVDTVGRSLRIHVHGEAAAVRAPAYLELEEPADDGQQEGRRTGAVARAAAAALAMGAALGVGGCSDPVEVRNNPPKQDSSLVRDAGPDRSLDIAVRDSPPKVDSRPPDTWPDDAAAPDQGMDQGSDKGADQQ